MKRAKHNLSHYRMITTDMGSLQPIACVPVLPGDTFQHATSALVRVSPLNTPVMHPVSVRLHHFYVPNRILWPESEGGGWESFITGGKDGNDQQTIPTVTSTAEKRSMLSFLGVPPVAGIEVNALPLRAVNQIINDYYIDQDLQTERGNENNAVFNVAWEKDYFTTSRPFTQKGPDVTLPLGTRAPIFTDAAEGIPARVAQGQEATQGYRLGDADTPGSYAQYVDPIDTGGTSNMFADLTAAEAINVNDFRAAFSIQRYQEARARYGSRFTEYLRYLGINPSDSRLQRAEFLGGGSTRLNFSEVLQTTPNDVPGQAGVGDLYGHGIAGVRSNAYRKFFEEHGYVVTMLSVRPKAIYENGVHREFLKRNKEDYWQRELQNLGQQEIFKSELFADADNNDVVFGYQDRYDEYRQHWSQVSQDFRDLLNTWHLARDLDDSVALNESFIRCVPSKRIFQVTEEYDTLWIMANHKIVARRMVSKRANPRIL